MTPATAEMIAAVAAKLRTMLGDDYDDETFLDTLDGETDAARIADRLIAKALEAESLATAALLEESALVDRRKRFQSHNEAYRATLLDLITATGMDKLERPRATVARVKPRQSVEITDPASVPSQLCKTVTTPDKSAIKAQLAAGEAVPGAALVWGEPTIMMRVK